ncbi:MAG: hypothetical protein AABX39_02105 [Nanoarchaeota archaeon]
MVKQLEDELKNVLLEIRNEPISYAELMDKIVKWNNSHLDKVPFDVSPRDIFHDGLRLGYIQKVENGYKFNLEE